ncbi:MAG: orotidine-5'-phosphate decarboxylase [Deltaproteobacteria bacterium]|nr:orotidine-5'-phosphate decarboxylase [Deltaproteobacteria bacterium]
MTEAADRLIVALDFSSADSAKTLVDQLDGVVSFFKVGLELHLVGGTEMVNWLLARGKRVFLDLKYNDIEETVERTVRQAAKLGISFLTVHGGGKIVQAAVNGRGDADLKILIVTVLTSLDNDDMRDLGFACTVDDLVLARAKRAAELGCDGVIASGREARTIREQVGGQIVIVTPGIRQSDGSMDDHKRHVDARTAICEGANYIVVGRPIRNAANPRAAAEEFVRQIQAGLDGRVQSGGKPPFNSAHAPV